MNNFLKFGASHQRNSVIEYLMWHYFGKDVERNPDLMAYYRNYFTKSINIDNVAALMQSFINRSRVALVREMDPAKKPFAKQVKCQTLLIAGSFSRTFDESVQLNSQMYPDHTEFFQVTGADGMILEEEPEKVSDSILLYLQGLGWVLVLC